MRPDIKASCRALLVASLSALGAAGVSILDAETRSQHPHVLPILADDLGWSDVTLHGTTKFYQTPNIERLAKRGMMITRAYRQAATLGSVMMWELSI